MKLTLKNFRAHQSKTFDISDKGLVLISGKSGCGKTTLLNAIIYALYGNIRRPYTHNEYTCSVVIDSRDIFIKRSSKPNRLVVKYRNKSYEDKEAQAIVDSIFGYEDKFMMSSYIVQNINSSVLSLAPTEQENFIEKLTFDNENCSTVEEIVKRNIKTRTQQRDEYQNSFNVAEGIYKNILKKHNALKLTVSNSDKDYVVSKDEINDINNIIKKTENELDIVLQAIQNNHSFLNELYLQKKKYNERNTRKNFLEISIKELQNHLDKYDMTIIDTNKNIEQNLHELSEQIRKLENFEKYTTEKNILDENIKIYFDELQNEKETIESKMKNENIPSDIHEQIAKLENLNFTSEESVKNAKKILQIRDEVSKKYCNGQGRNMGVKNVRKMIENKKKELAHILSISKVYKCPECDSNLFLENNKLHKHIKEQTADNIIGDVEVHLKDIDNYLCDVGLLEKNTTKITDSEKDILQNLKSKIIQYSSNKNVFDTICLKLEKHEIPYSLNVVREKLDKTYVDIKDYKPPDNDIRKIFEDKSILYNANKHIVDEINKYNTEHYQKCKELENIQIDELNIVKIDSDITNFGNEIQGQTSQIDKLQTLLKNSKEKLETLNSALKFQESLQELDENFRLLTESSKLLKEANERLASAVELEYLTKIAKLCSVEKMLDNINKQANLYLKDMFNDPIQIRIVNVKQFKTVSEKFRFNIVVEYKGFNYDSLDQLSGGERQRCNLAFLLAVNDVVGSPILMLDECLNNLDVELNMEIITYLKELCRSKLILVVSHESIAGLFDSVVEL